MKCLGLPLLCALCACSVSVGNPDAGTLFGTFAMPVAFVGFANIANGDGGASLVIDLSDVDYSYTCNGTSDAGSPAGQDLVLVILAPGGAVTAGSYPINPVTDNDGGLDPNPFDGGAVAQVVVLNPGAVPVITGQSLSGQVTLSEVNAANVVGTLQIAMVQVVGDAGGQLTGSFAAQACAIVGTGD